MSKWKLLASAAAALIAGLSIANAQSPSTPGAGSAGQDQSSAARPRPARRCGRAGLSRGSWYKPAVAADDRRVAEGHGPVKPPSATEQELDPPVGRRSRLAQRPAAEAVVDRTSNRSEAKQERLRPT